MSPQDRSSLPAGSFHRQLAQEVASIWVLDSHEHTIDEAERAAEAQDCFYLTAHYLKNDLISAGMPVNKVEALVDRSIPLEQRWQTFAPYWEFARTTGYGQAVEIAVRDVFGIDGLSERTYQDLSERIAATAGQPGWYDRVLKQQARIMGCVLDGYRLDADPNHFFPVMRFDSLIVARTPHHLRESWVTRGREIGSLNDCLAAIDAGFAHLRANGAVAIKCALACRRSLRFERVDRAAAERLFERLLRDYLPEAEAVPLQDFLFHEVCDRAGAHGFPYQIHTGLQSANAGANVVITNPVLLTNTLKEHPGTTFDLFHGGYPYTSELATLGKNFPNAYVNACWLAIIAPTVLRRMLHEWLDTVPHNKIQAFGGDYRYVELSYAHCQMARQAVADVLAERVAHGYLAEHDAPVLAHRLLADNGLALYKIPAERAAQMQRVPA